jgi:MFS family permease
MAVRRFIDPEIPQIFYVLLAGRLFNMIGNSLVFPFLSVFLASRLGGSMSLVGIVMSAYGLVQVGAVLGGGILADAWGRRRVMLLSLGGGAGAALLVGLVHPLWALFLALMLMGFLMPLFQPASMALTADLVPRHRLHEAYGLMRMASNAGIIVGPMVGSFLANISYFWLFAGDTITLLAFFILVQRVIPETRTARQETLAGTVDGLLTVARDRAFLGFAVLWALTSLVYSQMYQVLPAYLHLKLHFPPGEFGYLAAENALLVVALQMPISRLAGRLKPAVIMSLGLLCYAAGFFLMWHTKWLATFGLAVLIITVGENMVNPTASTWVAERADPALRGRYVGFFSLASRLGSAAGPLTGGFLISYSSSAWLLATSGVAIVTSVCYRRVGESTASKDSTPLTPNAPAS